MYDWVKIESCADLNKKLTCISQGHFPSLLPPLSLPPTPPFLPPPFHPGLQIAGGLKGLHGLHEGRVSAPHLDPSLVVAASRYENFTPYTSKATGSLVHGKITRYATLNSRIDVV